CPRRFVTTLRRRFKLPLRRSFPRALSCARVSLGTGEITFNNVTWMLSKELRKKQWICLVMIGSSIQLTLSREHRRYVRMTRTLSCWCGNTSLGSFSIGYLRCGACETLVAAQMPAVQDVLVQDDERDFYGKHYFDRLSKEF